jgi:hypothetical protein
MFFQTVSADTGRQLWVDSCPLPLVALSQKPAFDPEQPPTKNGQFAWRGPWFD